MAEERAPIVSGTLKISYQNGQYTIQFDFADDNNAYDSSLRAHKIKGTWTGALHVEDYATTRSALHRGLKFKR